MRNAKRVSSPYAPPCTMVSTKTGDQHTTSATTEPKTASGSLAAMDMAIDSGTTMRAIVNDIGDGTRSAAVTPVHKSQPHVRSTHPTGREASSAMVCQGEDNARVTHAMTTTQINTRCG